MLVVGSLALIQHIPMKREIKDMDLIIRPSELQELKDDPEHVLVKESPKKVVFTRGSLHIECEVATQGSNQEMLLDLLGIGEETVYADLELLYALKMSHRFLRNSPHFHKTMRDIHLIRHHRAGSDDDRGVCPIYRDWYERRVKDTYTYSHPKLNQGKDDFFTEEVFEGDFQYKYDHDSIHEAVAVGDCPAYVNFQDGPVMVSRKKFDESGYENQINSVYEESCVLALERAVVPNGLDKNKAFGIALMKVCTSIASGWWREFAWENYANVMQLYKAKVDTDQDYVKMFQHGLDNNVVQLNGSIKAEEVAV